MRVVKRRRRESAPTGHAILLLSLLAAVVPQVAPATEGDDAYPQARLAFLIGAHNWSSLGNLQSADGGSFESTGVNLVVAWHHDLEEFQHTTLLIGGELGLFTNESSIRGSLGELTSRGICLVPSLKLAFGRQRNIYVDAGAGFYGLDFAEFDCNDFGCGEIDQGNNKNRFGAMLGAGAVFNLGERWSYVLEAKVHFVDFGSVRNLEPQPQKLGGPIYMLQLGAAF